uniref:Cubilin n=1 Tax=Biomphalaria glabrata TaxID=6526 RepID=A0A2C9JE69_BIOGL
MDYQYLVVSEESLFHRARRQALEYISGYSTYRSKFTLGNREMTSTESQDGTGEFLRLRSSADDYISSTLQQAFPNRPIQIGITKLSTPHTTVEFEIQIHDDVDLNDTRKQLAKALDALDKADSFQLDSRTYSVEEVMLGKEGGDDSTLEYTICILCSDYQTCTQTNGVWTCQLSDPRLYSFGSVQQDSSMVKNVDYATVQLKVPDAITWGEEEVSNIWVSVNGFISLDSQFVSYIPRRLPMNSQKLLAVYWSDLELKSGDVGEVYYQIYSKYGRKYDPNIFKKANEDVKSYTGDESYDATSVIVVTWSDMAPYPLYRSETERVTFQCTIITDGTTTYAVYHYGHGAMRFNAQLRRPVEAGWGGINLDSSRVNYYNFDQNLGNTGVVGKWFFQIGRRENYKAKCLNWYYKNLQDYENIRFWDIVLPKCPCNEFFVWATGWWQMSNQNGVSCYESYNSYTPYGRVCCYRLDDWQLNWSSLSWMFSAFGRTFGTFENRMPFAGSLQRNSPYYRGNYNYGYFNNPMFDTNRYSTQTIFAYMHEVDDLEPKQWCCYQSNLCHLYYQVRPASNCIGPNVAFGIGFGDPQINTLDNKWFIFNGLGKYRLLEITGKHPKNTSLSVDFKLQGRTCKAVTSSGESTNATVWCALALKTTSGNTTKIEISETGNNMIIYANGQDYSLRFRNSLNFSEVNKDIYLRKDSITESLMISTADGVGLTVSLKNKILVYTLDVDEMYKSMTRGLLSNFNDDPSDDFIFPNSTKLSNNASDRQIYDYGQTWAVTQDSSLFDYIYGQNTSDPSFMPLFLDQLNTTEAVIVCNDATHIACIFDYAVTRNPGIALLTKITVDVFANQVKLVGNSAPTITGNRDYNVTINQTLNIVLNCTDPDKDNLSVVVLSKPNQGFTYSLIDGQLSLSYTPSKITDESIELVVHDSAGLDSGVLKLNLTMCSGCSSHGHCDFADRLTVNTPYKAIARCVCDVGYTGDDCELDRDGCLMEPCPDQTKCQDLDVATERATGLSFKCTDCPKGYKLVNNDTKCEDIDECQNTSNACPAHANCQNTIGSFECNCGQGFRKYNGQCIDINECAEYQDDCAQICINELSTFTCDCYEGYRKYGIIGHDCIQREDVCKGLNLTCEYGCTNQSGVAECFCQHGKKLADDKRSCIDIDECAVPSLSKCDQLCRNAPGGFACECLDGYSLNMTTRTTCVLSETAKACNSSSLCNQICTVVDDKDVCSCHLGYKLNSSNNVTCMDINECSGSNPCSSGQCNNIDGSFYCTCPAGYKLTSDQLTCQECEEGYYGTNCNSSCQCTSTNTVSCNTTDGSCVCKPGWQGQDCSVDINECSTNGVCYNNSQCINSQGSYKCVCATGYLSTGSSCNACDVNRYGQDCAQTCTCNFANTLDCHHTTGQCNCKPGWEGVNCDQDINECSNSSYCSGSFVQCINLNGSAECRCLSGYERPTNSSTCQDINECENSLLNNCLTPSVCNNTWGSYECVCMKGFHNVSGQCSACDSLHYGTNCAMDCQCHVNNTLDCDDINGTCTCRHGWTGQKCDLDVDECTQNASFCSSINETCTNLNGSAECLCNIGFYKAAFNESCRACGSLYYGLNCASQCSCNATNTEDCNDINGTCSCKSGWTGPICNQACNSTQYGPNCASQCLCNATNTEDCNDVNGTCSCKSGWTGDNCNQACNSTQYGPNCASQCLCNATNTEDCNDVNGTCSCKPGWTGPICNQACNSTQYGPNCASQCLCNATNTEDCNDVNGTCSCKPGWIGANCNQACNSTQYGPNCASQCLCNATNTEDCNDVNGTCFCKPGWTGTNCNQACNSTQYGPNCASQCLCNATNTEDCNDVNGTCFCKSGWTGANCNQGKCISILNQL